MMPILRIFMAIPPRSFQGCYQPKCWEAGKKWQPAGGKPTELIFTSGGNGSHNQAIITYMLNNRNKGNIITSAVEHHAVLHTCQFLAGLGL